MNFDEWIKRADEILKRGHAGHYIAAAEAYQFATSMISALYGPESSQMRSLRANADAIGKRNDSAGDLCDMARGSIKNAKAEIEAGLVQNWRAYVAGEVLAELVRLGKEILVDGTEDAKNVASVLIASAFEAVLRRMAEQLAGLTTRPPLQEVITILKNAEVLKGGEVHTANSYLKFRNDSLHADWAAVDRSQVEGCTLFTESLLGKHFS